MKGCPDENRRLKRLFFGIRNGGTGRRASQFERKSRILSCDASWEPRKRGLSVLDCEKRDHCGRKTCYTVEMFHCNPGKVLLKEKTQKRNFKSSHGSHQRHLSYSPGTREMIRKKKNEGSRKMDC